MDMGGMWILGLLAFLVLLPVVSFIHCATILVATWFAVGEARPVLRGLSVPVFIALSSVTFFAFEWFENTLGHVTVMANVTIPTIWLLAKYGGVKLLRVGDFPIEAHKSMPPYSGRFSIGFLFWLPVAIGHVLSLRLSYPPRLPRPIGVDIVKSMILAAVFVVITVLVLKLASPGRRTILVLTLVVPVIGFMHLFWWPPGVIWCMMLPLLFGSPMLVALLWQGRSKGYRLTRTEPL